MGKRPALCGRHAGEMPCVQRQRAQDFTMMKSSESPKIRRMRTASTEVAHRGHEPEEKFAFFQKGAEQMYPLQRVQERLSACSCRKCVSLTAINSTAPESERGFLRGEDVPYHPRVPCGGKMYGLWRVQQGMSPGNSLCICSTEIHQGYQ